MEDPAQDVNTSHQYMAKPPNWITKWGTLLIALVFVCFLIGIFNFPYPNTIDSEITIMQDQQQTNVGVLKVPSKELNQLAIGQKVAIHLHRYPFSAYGALMGKVSYISDERDTNGLHDIKVHIDDLITTHETNIPSDIKLEGKAIIKLPETSLAKILLNATK